MKPTISSRARQRGFTLLEVAAAFTIFTFMLAPMALMYRNNLQTRVVNRAIGELNFIGEAAQAYFTDVGSFPDQGANCANAVATLVAAGYLGGTGTTSPFATPYVTSCTPATRLQIQVNATSANQAAQVISGVPRATRAGTTITAAYVIPGSLPPLANYLRRNVEAGNPAANRMDTNLDMNNNNVNNINTANAASVNTAALQAGTPLVGSTGNVEVGRNAPAGVAPRSGAIDFHFAGRDEDFNSRIASTANGVLTVSAPTSLNITSPQTNLSGNLSTPGTITASDVVLSSLGNFSLRKTIQDVRIVENGDLIPKPTCPAGLTQGVVLAGERVAEGLSPSAFYGFKTSLTDAGANYQLNATVYTGGGERVAAAGFLRVASFTFCY